MMLESGPYMDAAIELTIYPGSGGRLQSRPCSG